MYDKCNIWTVWIWIAFCGLLLLILAQGYT